MPFENKLVIIINKDIETGVAMNAVGHTSLAMGALLGSEKSFLQDYQDASNNTWPMSGMPYIMLRGKSGEIRKAVLQAKAENIMQLAFTGTMTEGTYLEQIERTAEVAEDAHIYYAAALFGPWDKVSAMTKKFSLYR